MGDPTAGGQYCRAVNGAIASIIGFTEGKLDPNFHFLGKSFRFPGRTPCILQGSSVALTHHGRADGAIGKQHRDVSLKRALSMVSAVAFVD